MEITDYSVPHKSTRTSSINAIVIHDTGGKTAKGTLEWFMNPRSKVSSHYLIERDGSIYRCVPDSEKAWHAGASELYGRKDVNDFSIGIELVDDDPHPYPSLQMEALVELCSQIILKYKIPLNRVVGHEHICVPAGRKVDPGADFDWYGFLLSIASMIIVGE